MEFFVVLTDLRDVSCFSAVLYDSSISLVQDMEIGTSSARVQEYTWVFVARDFAGIWSISLSGLGIVDLGGA